MIVCSHLSKRFGAIVALDDFSCSLNAGRVAVIGPNGSGKTTLLNVISGFVRPDAGTCEIVGQRIDRWPPHRVARLGVRRAFQDVRVVEALTAVENIVLALDYAAATQPLRVFLQPTRSLRRNYVLAADIAERFRLSAHLSTPAAALSYGMRKLLSLACAAAQKPKILLLDEPAAGVARPVKAQLGTLIQEMPTVGLVMMIEHDLEFVRAYTERTLVMSQGQLVDLGPTADVTGDKALLRWYLR